ncbi:MAG: DUF3047 domain-containing protein [Proteobacteria bacterium]|nr:DUF3047 domain-containing protein [Pseudomonadota bacterium]
MSTRGQKVTGCRSAPLIIALIFLTGFVHAEAGVFFRDDFRDLANWEPLTFPKIERHTAYSAVSEGDRSYLKAESRASASAIVLKRTFDVRSHPILRWRWKVDNVYRNADGTEKGRDDYPIRIYVAFEYDPRQADLMETVRYAAIKALYGKYPPHSSLNYVWASDPRASSIAMTAWLSPPCATSDMITTRPRVSPGSWERARCSPS